MKILIAADSFKGSLSSAEAGEAIKAGILRSMPDAGVSVYPVADGGEGTAEALVHALHGRFRGITVCDPLGRPVQAKYGILPDSTAVIEMAAASGLTLLKPEERNPMQTTTFGFGEMIADAVKQGCRRMILGIGGSATNDAGIGCLQALGFGILDTDGNQVLHGAAGLAAVQQISLSDALPELRECSFSVACDVQNPLCGETGCSKVFAPQKGADASMIAEMDAAMLRFAGIVRRVIPGADPDAKGAGAAGGLGFALCSFLHAKMQSGIDLVLEETVPEEQIAAADLIVTGEGCMDAQTAMGKAPAGIAALAKRHSIPVIAFSGIVKDGAQVCNTNGIDAYFPVLRDITSADEAMKPENAAKNLTDTAEQVFRLILRIRQNSDP